MLDCRAYYILQCMGGCKSTFWTWFEIQKPCSVQVKSCRDMWGIECLVRTQTIANILQQQMIWIDVPIARGSLIVQLSTMKSQTVARQKLYFCKIFAHVMLVQHSSSSCRDSFLGLPEYYVKRSFTSACPYSQVQWFPLPESANIGFLSVRPPYIHE